MSLIIHATLDVLFKDRDKLARVRGFASSVCGRSSSGHWGDHVENELILQWRRDVGVGGNRSERGGKSRGR